MDDDDEQENVRVRMAALFNILGGGADGVLQTVKKQSEMLFVRGTIRQSSLRLETQTQASTDTNSHLRRRLCRLNITTGPIG